MGRHICACIGPICTMRFYRLYRPRSFVVARSSWASIRLTDRVLLTFADGSSAHADAVVGADGVHSVVRELILGADEPVHRGRIAYRAVFPAALMNGRSLGSSRTKWWGIDRHIVIYYTNNARSEIYFVTQCPGAGRVADAQNPGRPRVTW